MLPLIGEHLAFRMLSLSNNCLLDLAGETDVANQLLRFFFPGFTCQVKSRQLKLYTLPETNSSHLKMNGWNPTFLLGPGIFSGTNLLLV